MITQDGTNVKHIMEHAQWVAWRYDGKRKIPINPNTHRQAKPNEPATWSTYENAIQAAESCGHSGVGFVFSARDPFTGVDLDNCVDPQTGEVSPEAAEIVERLDSYTEISPSGTGLKVWVRAEKPGGKCRTGNIEIYDRDRYFTYTGDHLPGTPHTIEDRQHELNNLYKHLFADEAKTANTGAAANPTGPDEKLLEVARNERGGEFSRLYDHGDTSKYDSASSADYRLCVKLVFYFGDDPARIEGLFNGSALGQRIKWKNRADYRQRTIAAAIKAQDQRYTPKPEPKNDVSDLRAYASTAVWAGRGGPVDHAVYEALLDTVVVHGSHNPEGFTVCAPRRDLAVKAGCDGASASRSLKRLEAAGYIKLVKAAKDSNAATYLVCAGGADKMRKAHHITYTTPVFNMVQLAQSLRKPAPQRKKTISAREPGRTVSITIDSPYLVQSIGKLAGLVLVKIAEHPDGITIKDLAKSLSKRSNDLKRRQIPALLEFELITVGDGGRLRAVEDVEARLEEHLRLSGCYEQERLQREGHEREREAYRTRNQRPADTAPTEDELEAERKIREVYEDADGVLEELEKHNVVFDTFEPSSNPQQPIEIVAGEDGIHHHGSLCECWLCEDAIPKYASTVAA